MTTQIERLARLEERVRVLESKVDGIDHKLDQLLELRYKGVGAFWLASTLIGTGIVGALFQVAAWFRS
jgi:hypothetical protein